MDARMLNSNIGMISMVVHYFVLLPLVDTSLLTYASEASHGGFNRISSLSDVHLHDIVSHLPAKDSPLTKPITERNHAQPPAKTLAHLSPNASFLFPLPPLLGPSFPSSLGGGGGG
uniref:Uncharacterized protein n=1 Tax=Oryza nivara TaxID=4536 RepID=A0A0E0FLM7_ORYNI